MQTKAYSIQETIFILFVLTSIGSIFTLHKPYLSKKDEIISNIIHAQFIAFQQHVRMDISHPLVGDTIWFNMSGNVNEANTVDILGTKESFTIMLHTGRIH